MSTIRLRYTALILLYLATRIVFLTRLPIFNDEAMYLHWGLLFRDDPTRWFTSLVIDGKQPGMVMVLGTLLRLPGDPLVLGRFVSVVFGLITFILSIEIVRKLKPAISIVPIALLLICSPFLLHFERLALMESAVTACSVAAAYAIVRWLKTPRLHYAVLFGAVVSAGWWFKSTALLIFLAGCVSAIAAGLTKGNRMQDIGKFIFFGISIYILLTLPSRIDPQFTNIAVRERERVVSFEELISLPYDLWWKNVLLLFSFMGAYVTPVVLLFVPRTFLRLKHNPELTVVFIFALFPILMEVLVSKIFTSRYLMISVPFLYILMVVSLAGYDGLVRKMVKSVVFGIVSFQSLILIISPLRYYSLLGFAPYAQDDFGQYVRSFSSGYGVMSAVQFAKERSLGKKVTLIVRADSGNPEDAVFVYADRDPNLIAMYDVTYANRISQGTLKVTDSATYFISRGAQLGILAQHLTEIRHFDKPLGEDFVGVYELKIDGSNSTE
jgi:hypothetical protein